MTKRRTKEPPGRDKNPNWTPRRTRPPDTHASGWLGEMDQRMRLSQDLRARYDELLSDLGGAEHVNYAKRSLAERAILLEFWIATQEKRLVEGERVDIGRWTQSLNAYAGLLGKLGLERKARDVPDLQDYLKRHAAASGKREGAAQ